MAPNYPEWTVGDRLRKARRSTGMSQRDFAAKLRVRELTYAAWESDRNHVPPVKLLRIARKIRTLTGIPVDWFLSLERQPGAITTPSGTAAKVDVELISTSAG